MKNANKGDIANQLDGKKLRVGLVQARFNADITDARTFQQWKDAGRHIRTGEEGYTAIVGQVYENNGRKASGYNIGKVFDITQTRGRPVPPPRPARA